MARYAQDPEKLIDQMIRQGRCSDEIAAEAGVKEHFILARMKELADAAEATP